MDFRTPVQNSKPGIGDAGSPCLPGSLEWISALRPTQIAVGYREVLIKSQKLDAQYGAGNAPAQKRLVPVIVGPGGHFYLRDGHHLVLALHFAGHESARVSVVADLSNFGIEAFWRLLDERNWVRPFDSSGRRRQFRQMPSSVLSVEDDPYRSLAGALRRCGGFVKNSAPYAEFAWADFLRSRIDLHLLAQDFLAALALAREFAASRATEHLPGWLGSNGSVRTVPNHLT